MYQKSNLQEKNIVIADIQDTGNNIIIVDTDNDKYSFFKNKKDGTPSVAYSDSLNFPVHSRVNVVFEQNGNFKNLARIKPATGADSPSPQYTPAPRTPNPPAISFSVMNKDSLIGCLAVIKGAGLSLADLEQPGTLERVVGIYRKLVTATSPQQNNLTASLTASLPVIQQNDDINVEGIPF